jgi:hypothetical protein
MTNPRQAEATALGRYYTRPGEDAANLISVTNVLSVGCAKPALVPWAAKIAAEYAIERQGALMAKSRTDRDGAIKDIKAQVTVARDKAADLGSRIHALAEAHVIGQQLAEQEGDDQAKPFVAQYERFFADFDIDITRDIEAAELTVADPAQGWAGTLDLLVRLPLDGFVPGMATKRVDEPEQRGLFVVDLKTSATRAATSVYGEYALQLTALRSATEAWLPDGSIIPMPRGIVGVAVLNLRARTYELVPLPSGDAERKAWQGCLALAKWMHGTGHDIAGGEYRPITPNGAAKPKRASTRKAAA